VKIIPIAFVLLAGLLGSPLRASEPVPSLTGFVDRYWTPREGAPRAFWGITQTADGTLWFATEHGLYWFDGAQFLRFAGTPTQPLSSDLVTALYAAPRGGLWMGFRLGGVAFFKEGTLVLYTPDGKRLPEATVKRITTDRDGTLWITTSVGVSRYTGGHWESVQEEWGLPRGTALDLFMDHAGTVWVRASDRLFFLPHGARRFIERQVSTDERISGAMISLAAGPEDKLWIAGSQTGVHPLGETSRAVIVPKLPVGPNLGWPMTFDSEGALWYTAPGAILRYANPTAAAAGAQPHLERFDVGGDAPWIAPFEDREGNIWVATHDGPARLSRASLRMVTEEYTDFGLVTASDGAVWWSRVNPATGTTSIVRLQNDAPVQQTVLPDEVSCAYRDPSGSLWFGGRKALWQVQGHDVRSTPLPSEAINFETQALARDGSGGLWYSARRAGVFRYADGKWERNGNLPELPPEPAITMTTDARGHLWLAYTRERLVRVDRHEVRVFGRNDGLHIGNVTALASHGDNLWIGGEHGVLRFDGNRFIPVHVSNEEALQGLWGIVETASGELWGAGSGGIVRLRHSQLAELIRSGTSAQPAQLFDFRDGLPSDVKLLRPIPPIVEGGDGRLWFSLTSGIGYIDPTHIPYNALPPPVLMTGITAAGREFFPFDNDIRLPVGTTQLRIAYAANSFTVPERVQFRYELEGLDHGWQDAGNRREAVYTNVAPGRYRFRVIAANNDGVWNLTGVSLSFTVLPAFYQTGLFYAACAIAGIALLYLAYHIRVRKITAAVRSRLEERILERERIARELHDTLLQGLQGLILRFQAVAARIPTHEQASDMMERALTRADQLLIESRDRVKDIRFSTDAGADMPGALAALGEELSQDHPARFSIQVEGSQRRLHPATRDEVTMIGREALLNAFRHAGARKIEVEIEFARSELRLRIRDDGKGVDSQVLKAGGATGHWGLRGMRERAKKLRAHLRIWSRAGLGTEVELRIPSSLAYGRTGETRRWWWPGRRATLTQRGE